MTAPKGASSPSGTVQLSMKKVSFDVVEQIGAPTFDLCDRYGDDSLSLGVDFDQQCYETVFAVIDGKPYEQVRACVNLPPTHRASDHIDAALAVVYHSGRGESA